MKTEKRERQLTARDHKHATGRDDHARLAHLEVHRALDDEENLLKRE
jgi:hypothetical protein